MTNLVGQLARRVAVWRREGSTCLDCKHYQIRGDITLYGWCGHKNRPTNPWWYCVEFVMREDT